MPETRAIDDESAWGELRRCWLLRGDTIYLNHGSFGPPPNVVQEARQSWQARLDSQPMDFFLRQMEEAYYHARRRLAEFVGTAEDNLVFVDNACYGMNVAAGSFPLQPGDQVLLTDHAYGAVRRIWQRACDRSGAELKTVALPLPIESREQLLDEITAAFTDRTRLFAFSHITSATAVTMPAAEICQAAKAAGVATCIDGPHAVAQLPLEVDALDCDFYVASLHKWLCAPFGSGFFYAHPRQQEQVQPLMMSWGRLDSETPVQWDEEFPWQGTRDPSPWLSVPTAIDFLQDIDLQVFRQRTHYLARYARQRLSQFTPDPAITPDDPAWYTAMAHVPLPPGEARPLQIALWVRHGIEVPIIEFAGRRWIRVSCHLYNGVDQIDTLTAALGELLA